MTENVSDLEKIIIGALLSWGRKWVKIVSESLKPEHFESEKYREMFIVILEMSNNNLPIDIHSFVQEVSRQNRLSIFGGVSEIILLTDHKVHSIESVQHYVKILQENFINRSIYALSLKAHEISQDKSISPLEKMIQVERQIREVRKLISTGKNITTAELVNEVVMKIAKEVLSGVITGTPTGFPKLDELITGILPKEFTIIAGRPGMGKTAFLMAILMFIAFTLKKRVLMFSREMSAEQLIIRILSILTGIPIRLIRRKQLDNKQLDLIETASRMITECLIIDDYTTHIEEMESKTIRLIDEGEIILMSLDYIQITETMEKSNNREQEISKISRKCKRIANDYDIAVIGLSQLSREPDKRSSGKNQFEPQLSDLRESGALEQDADCVLLLYRPEYYKLFQSEKGENLKGRIKIIVAKHRNEEPGYVWLDFDSKHAQFLSEKETVHPQAAPGLYIKPVDTSDDF